MKNRIHNKTNKITNDLLEKFQQSIKFNQMEHINLRDSYTYKKIIFGTEAELYKYKRKLYP
jgi:hypothetical protein